MGSRASQDYELSKYTNTGAKKKHNTMSENYASVGGMDARFATGRENAEAALATLADLPPDVRGNYEAQFRQQTAVARLYGELRMDIITLRNRFWHSDPKLSWVLTELWAKGYEYDTIHCSFCRGNGTSYMPPKVNWAA